MATGKPGIAVGIDFGEMNTVLSGILGIGKGIAEEKSLNQSVSKMVNTSSQEFGQYADSLGDGELAHVYEYGREGNPSGRLWDITWQQRAGDMVGNIVFRTARRPTQLGAGIDETLSREAAGSGRTIAGHLFPQKADVLETTKQLVSEAGRRVHTQRVGGDVDNPRMLVYIDDMGKVRFAKRRVRDNEHYRKFEQAFTAFWISRFETGSGEKVNRAFSSAVNQGVKEVNRAARIAGGASRPRIPTGMSGVYITDRGRPFVGYRLRDTEVRRVSKKVSEHLAREMLRQW